MIKTTSQFKSWVNFWIEIKFVDNLGKHFFPTSATVVKEPSAVAIVLLLGHDLDVRKRFSE
jgi:hypothetical protein